MPQYLFIMIFYRILQSSFMRIFTQVSDLDSKRSGMMTDAAFSLQNASHISRVDHQRYNWSQIRQK